MERPAALPPTQILITGDGIVLRPAAWARRAVSVTLFGAIALFLVTTAPLWLPLGLAVDWVRQKRLATVRAMLFLTLFFASEVAGIVIATWLWIRHRRSSQLAYTQANLALQRWWSGTLWWGARTLFRLDSQVEGSDVGADGPFIAMFRHSSVADTLLPMVLMGIPHRVALRWVLKSELLWDPCMDIVGNRLPNCFVSRMPDASARDVAAVGTLMDGLGPDEGVVIYPEGTRFTQAKRQRLIDKLGESAAAFANVLPPRLGGALALLEHNQSGADVIFGAHTGFDRVSTLGDLFNGELIGNTIRVELWRIRFEDIPTKTEERIAWLLGEWKRVDRFVGADRD